MATIKVISVVKRTVTVEVTWANGWKRTISLNNLPVESMADTMIALNEQITNWYNETDQEKKRLEYENPVIDPQILAAVSHTFDDLGNILS